MAKSGARYSFLSNFYYVWVFLVHTHFHICVLARHAMVKDSKHLNFVNEIHMNEIIFLCRLNPEGWHLEARGSRKGLFKVGDTPWPRRFKCLSLVGLGYLEIKLLWLLTTRKSTKETFISMEFKSFRFV